MVKLLGKLFKGNTLYYPGCLTKTVAKDIEANYKKLLSEAGVDFIMLKDSEVCCGRPILNAGNRKDAIELAKKNFNIFKEHGVKKIITACPACYQTFLKDYPALVPGWDIEVEFAMITLDKAIKSGKLKVVKLSESASGKKEKVTYHDPCHLSRVCNIYDEPRNVIKSTGVEIKEMKLSRNYSFCCGAGSGVRNNYPEIAHAIGKERIMMAKETGADVLVTPCPMCYMHLKDNSDGKIKVKEASQMLVDESDGKGGRK